jgi:5-methyltetrahydropteroyltriglutamate--homocysteine methyltransferase
MILPTSTIGSFPKPEYLKEARRRFDRGEIRAEDLRQLEEKATRDCVRMQEDLGLDVLVDGEMYRGDMTAYFAEHLEGFGISGLVRSYGNRYYRKPIINAEVRRRRPITVDWWRFAQSLTQKPVKAILTGPYTMMDWSFDEHYGSREKSTMALAGVIHQEVADLEAAGARYIQIDEPAISVRPDEIQLAIAAMRLVTQGIRAKTITHICYGDFAAIYPKMLELAVDQFDLELSNSGYDMLELFKRAPFTKEIGYGVLDVHSHKVETVDQVKDRLRMALEVFPVERIYVNPDCGLKTRTEDEARDKLLVMVEATRAIRSEIES